MTADVLADWSNVTLVESAAVADLVRYVIAAMAALTAALLLRLYASHRTGKMNRVAGAGATSTYAVVAWAQIVAIGGPTGELTALNVGVFVSVALSLAGTIRAMDSSLFRRRQ